MAIKVLLVEDDRALREALADTLLLAGHDYRAVGSAEDALEAVEQETFSLVVSDVNMPGMDGHQLLGLLRARQPQLPVLLMTAHGAVERAVDAMRQGAADYLVKPFEPKALLDLVQRHALGGLDSGEGPVAFEPASAQLLELAARVARSDSTVLISGESGTGKEVLARYIHQQSPRAAEPFVAINCAAIPDNMLEATLFGHEKGAFTGAIAAQVGKFEQAEGGTLLLDEISEMPLGLQAKLLRVLQEREVERVGGRKPISLDIRVLATTNRDLAGEVADRLQVRSREPEHAGLADADPHRVPGSGQFPDKRLGQQPGVSGGIHMSEKEQWKWLGGGRTAAAHGAIHLAHLRVHQPQAGGRGGLAANRQADIRQTCGIGEAQDGGVKRIRGPGQLAAVDPEIQRGPSRRGNGDGEAAAHRRLGVGIGAAVEDPLGERHSAGDRRLAVGRGLGCA